jgi:hypothetical protein
MPGLSTRPSLKARIIHPGFPSCDTGVGVAQLNRREAVFRDLKFFTALLATGRSIALVYWNK